MRARLLLVWAVLLPLLGVARPAGAQPDKPEEKPAESKDTDALVTVGEALELLGANKADQALEKLTKTLEQCASCEPGTRALVASTLGIVYGTGKSDLERAQAAFELALREDPALELDRQFAGKDVGRVFAEAQKEVKRLPKSGKGATRLPPTKSQRDANQAAQKQLAAGNWSDCMATLVGAMDKGGFAEGKLTLARCEETGGLLIEASKDAARAVELAKGEADKEIEKSASQLVAKLDDDTPRIIVEIPASIDSAVVKIDGVEHDKALAKKGIPVNPGKATIEVVGKKAGYPFTFKTVETIDRGEKITVDVSQSSGSQNSAVQQCLANAKTADEVALCLETGGKGRGLTFRGALEVSSYNDSQNVDVLSPAVKLAFENPTQGWLVGGTALVDVVSAASPDIVATASRRFDQARFAGTIGADLKIDAVKIGVSGAVSYESDYVGRAGGARLSADMADKRVTPSVAYTFGYDTIGMDGTPFDQFSNELFVHTVDVGISAVLSATTVLTIGGTFVHENGDQTKPYRHIPLFGPGVAEGVPRGATPELVADSRLPLEPGEHLPDTRNRGAFAAGLRHRFETSTLRIDERLYIDSWGLKASTLESRFLFDVGESTRLGPHVRFHIQSGVDFWQRAYTASGSSFPLTLPEFRTGDRELGPLFGLSLGGTFRQKVSDSLAFGLAVDGLYSQFLDHLYVFDRWGLFTASTMEVVIE